MVISPVAEHDLRNHQVKDYTRRGHPGGRGLARPGGEVICKLVAEDGNTGPGEAYLRLPETGVSPGQVITVIHDYLGKYILELTKERAAKQRT